MSIKIVFEFDGEIMLNDVPVEYSPTRIVEAAFRQLRAEISDYRDEFSGLCHTLSVGSEGRPEMTANDWRKRVDDGINWLTSPMIKRYESAETERDKLRADIAERDARIGGLQSRLAESGARCLRAEAELARVTKCLSKANDQAEHFEREWYLRGHALEEKEAELARLRAQGPVAWMWNDMIGIPHTHISPTRPTWPDAGASSAMSVAINVRPLYAEPMPAPSLKDNEIAQLVNALRDCAVEFHAAQQLRERIAAIVVPALRGVRSPMPAKVAG